MKRRSFIKNYSFSSVGLLLAQSTLPMLLEKSPRQRIAIVGTGIRGTGFWGQSIMKNFNDLVELVGLCDINPGRLQWASDKINAGCKTFTDFGLMMTTARPETVIITTMDSTHDQFIIKALEMGANVITEKPMTTDEIKCRSILEAEKKSGRKVTVAFNYRHSPHALKIKEILANKSVGKITSVDFSWMLNIYHGADYFRRWHGIMANSGSLLVHKATHHFDLLNWWINSEPIEISAYGELNHYGKNNSFRGISCRTCNYKKECKFYWDINGDPWATGLYVQNEKYDGYLRDGCLWRNEIDIYDKMSVQVKYANGVLLNYCLTTYSPYEGWQAAFNGMDGRVDSWEDIPYLNQNQVNQENKHITEMDQKDSSPEKEYNEIVIMKNFAKEHQTVKVPLIQAGHGGGDQRMLRRIFRDKHDNPYNILAGTREGAMSLLIGVAARKSIQLKRPVRIEELTDLVPMVTKA